MSGIEEHMSLPERASILVALFSALMAVIAIVVLERQRSGLAVDRVWIDRTPVTVWRPDGSGPAPLVVIAHGYGGSRQMMTPIAVSLARAGFAVATFDFHGHGRHPVAMSGDVTSLEGTTADLVRQTNMVVDRLRGPTHIAGPLALVGHSMATDIIVRAAMTRDDVAALVAISMYSEAVTSTEPETLLIISGAFEDRLRMVARDAVRMVEPTAQESETAEAGTVRRRAVAAPGVGHVGVLYSATTLTETRDWIAGAVGQSPDEPTDGSSSRAGLWIAGLLLACLALAWPLACLLGPPGAVRRPADRAAWIAVAAPILPTLAAVLVVPPGVFG
ncbi:MAG: alpha/beta fold hydrolase, partial [Jannaschia sp.]